MNIYEKAQDQYKGARVILPEIPEELRKGVVYPDQWAYASGSVPSIHEYNVMDFVREAVVNPGGNYVLLAHSGHGINSYAISFFLIYNGLHLFIFKHFGGVYQDPDEAVRSANLCFSLANQIINSHAALKHKVEPLIVATDFYGGGWQTQKPDRKTILKQENSRKALTMQEHVAKVFHGDKKDDPQEPDWMERFRQSSQPQIVLEETLSWLQSL